MKQTEVDTRHQMVPQDDKEHKKVITQAHFCLYVSVETMIEDTQIQAVKGESQIADDWRHHTRIACKLNRLGMLYGAKHLVGMQKATKSVLSAGYRTILSHHRPLKSSRKAQIALY